MGSSSPSGQSGQVSQSGSPHAPAGPPPGPIQQQVSGPPPAALPPPGVLSSAPLPQLPPTTSYGAYTPQLGALAGRVPIQPHTTVDATAALNPYLTNVQNTVASTQLPQFNLSHGVPSLDQTGGATPTTGEQILALLQKQQQGQPPAALSAPVDPPYNG